MANSTGGFAFDQKHYNGLSVQPIELMQATFTPEEMRGFLKGNVIKYALRQGLKEGESETKDCEKMMQYTEWLKKFNETGRF